MRILPIALLFLSVPAQAANWVHFADCGSPGQVRTYWYDAQSVRSKGADRTVRIRGDYSKAAGSPVADARIVWTIDCSARTFSERQRSEYRANGSLAVKYGRPTESLPAADDSVAAKLIARVCV